MAQKNKKPRHVAIIMDGNGRWATRRGKERLVGHRAGAETVRNTISYFGKKTGVEYLTLFAFASNNFGRDGNEVIGLNRLAGWFVADQLKALVENGVRVRFIGNQADGRVPETLLRDFRRLEEATARCSGLNLQIAWNYSGYDEIIRAEAAGVSVTELYSRLLDVAEAPAVDLVIRTGVENPEGLCWRDSDFLPLSTAHAVKVPMQVLFPDFGESHINEAIRIFDSEPHLMGGQRKEVSASAAE